MVVLNFNMWYAGKRVKACTPGKKSSPQMLYTEFIFSVREGAINSGCLGFPARFISFMAERKPTSMYVDHHVFIVEKRP